MRIFLAFLALSGFAAEPLFLRPVSWLGDLVASGENILVGTSGRVVELDLSGKVRRELSFPAGFVQALAVGEGVLAAGGWDLVRLWRWPEGEVLVDIRGFGAIARALAIHEGLVLVGTGDGRVLAFSKECGALVWEMRAHESAVWGLSASFQFLATAGSDRVAIWDLEERREIQSFLGRAWDVDFSPDGALLAAGVGKILHVWDTAFWLSLFSVWAHDSCTVAVAFSLDGRWIGTGSLDETAAVWDGERGALVARILGFAAVPWAVAFTPDGAFFVAGAEDGTLAFLPLRNRE